MGIGEKIMRVTEQYQITIPEYVVKLMEITPESEVDFKNENGKYYLVKLSSQPEVQNPFSQFRGIATTKMTTEQILSLTRDYK